MAKKYDKLDTDFRIVNKNAQLKRDIINIAANKGVNYSLFLRTEIIKIRDAYPAHMKLPVDKT